MMSEELLAGAVEIDITPPVGTGFAGYGARKGSSLGVHDPLLAQLLLLKSGEDQLVLITMDLLGVGLDFARRVRAGIQQAIGVPSHGTMITCSHTHSGPAGFLPPLAGTRPPEDPELQNITAQKLVGSAVWARERLQPARLGVGRGEVRGIGRNRNDPEKGALDEEAVVLRVDDVAGQPLAVVMNYGCHPTVMGYQNLLLSADYPGAARATLRRIYPDTIFMYTNGASGDVSTRFTRREQTFAEVERMGSILAGEVLKVMQTIVGQHRVPVHAHVAPVELKFRSFPPVAEAQKELERLQAALKELEAAGASHGEIRKATTRAEGAAGQVVLGKEMAGRAQNSSEVQVLEIGDLALVGLPGEPFTRTVLEIKGRSHHRYTAVISYANDDQGYFPDAVSVAEGTYEALISPYGDGVAGTLRDVALRLLQKA
jgi:neutral ceramidase